jgi:predicted N-acetyltransferase YhbS
LNDEACALHCLGGKTMSATLRPINQADVDACGVIVYKAFAAFATRTGLSPSFPTIEIATTLVRNLTDDAATFGVVAERDGKVIGSNFLTMGDRIGGVGPVTVSPSIQGSGVGRRLMQAVISQGRELDGIRLVQDSANILTVSLYAALGFEVKEPLLAIAGTPREIWWDCQVRPLGAQDVAACNELCTRIHGFNRAYDVDNAQEPFVAIRDGRVTGYLTSATLWQSSHGVAETEQDMQALLSGSSAATGKPVALLLPTRQASLLRWCLSNSFKALRPMTLMAMGAYNKPGGVWFPSLWYRGAIAEILISSPDGSRCPAKGAKPSSASRPHLLPLG